MCQLLGHQPQVVCATNAFETVSWTRAMKAKVVVALQLNVCEQDSCQVEKDRIVPYRATVNAYRIQTREG